MKHINWNSEKSLKLKKERGVCFEDIVYHIERGELLDDFYHPNQSKYPGQKIMVLSLNNYTYLVPYAENDEELFLKTIIPSRQARKKYLGVEDEN